MSAPAQGGAPAPAAPAGAVEAPAAVAAATAPVLTVAPAVRAGAPALAAGTSALARVQEAAAQLLPQAQYWIMRLGAAGQAGLVALAAAVVIAASMLLPAQHALQSLSADLLRAQHSPAGPSLEEAVPRLIGSLPTRAQVPAVLAQVYAQAKAAGVALDSGRYTYSPPKGGSIARYDIEFPVKAGYPQIRSFVDGTLTAVPAAALTRLRVERKTVGDQVVSADIGFALYVRSGEQP